MAHALVRAAVTLGRCLACEVKTGVARSGDTARMSACATISEYLRRNLSLFRLCGLAWAARIFLGRTVPLSARRILAVRMGGLSKVDWLSCTIWVKSRGPPAGLNFDSAAVLPNRRERGWCVLSKKGTDRSVHRRCALDVCGNCGLGTEWSVPFFEPRMPFLPAGKTAGKTGSAGTCPFSQAENDGSLLCSLFRLLGFAWAAWISPVAAELCLYLVDEFWRSVGPDGEVELLNCAPRSDSCGLGAGIAIRRFHRRPAKLT